MEHQVRTRLLSAFVIAVVFAAGVLIGLAADSNLGAAPTSPPAAEEPGEEPEGEEEPRRRGIWTQVNPTPGQEEQIQAIVRVHRERTNALDDETRKTLRRGFRAIALQTREEIKRVLTPEQATEYQRLLDEWDARQEEERRREREGGEDDER